MAFQPAPGVARLETVYAIPGGIAENVFHIKTTDDWSAEFLESLCTTFEEWWRAEMKPIQSQDISLTTIKARDLTTEFASYFELPVTTDNDGDIASPVMPGNVTASIKWTTGLTGRSTRGRTYHIGLAESQCAGSEITSGQRTAMLAAYDALEGYLTAEEPGWTMAVLSRVQNGATLPEAIAYEITGMALDVFLDSQRRRLSGRGV